MDTVGDEDVARVQLALKVLFASANVQVLPVSLVKRSLICCNYDTDAAAQLISDFVEFKREHPKLFITCFDQSVRETLGKVFTSINSKGPHGETIILTKVRDWDPQLYTTDFLNSAQIFAFYALSLDPEVLRNGFIHINDVRDMAWKHVRATKPLSAVSLFRALMNLPLQVKYIYGFNINWASDLMYRAMKPFLPKNITQKIILATDIDKLMDTVGRVDKESICQPTKIDVESFINKVDARADEVMKEWQGIDHMFK